MLTLTTGGKSRDCEGNTRRDFLRVGTLGLGGLSLADLLAARSRAASSNSAVKDTAVVVLFLQGGPTHIETFDPKMTAPLEYHAMYGETPTKLPGVTFGSHFPQLAARADRLAVVRSFRHGNGSHASASNLVISGGNPTGAAMGSLFTRVAGTNNPATGIPNNIVLPPKAAGEAYKALGAATQRVTPVGSLPPSYAPFDPSAGGTVLDNMQLRIPSGRLDDRRGLLGRLDRIRRAVDSTGNLEGADKFQQQAFDVIVGGVHSAFDLNQEDPRTIERYDTAAFKIPPKLKKKKSNVPRQSPIALGKQMLMARRLVESGCSFVTVTSAGWDMHGNAFGINDGMPLLGPAVDKAVSAFLDDLEQRGLSERVLLVITGEFGRTPRINKKGGRDHWGNLCTLALAGGGLKMGQVVGESDRKATAPASDPVSPQDLLATIMTTMFDIGTLRVVRGIPADVNRAIVSGQPIAQLV